MLTDWASKNLIPAIGSTKALIHIFIVILFFENYLICFQNKSLFEITISFKQIYIAPFIWFFFFIAVAKFIWFLIWVIITQVFYESYQKNEDKISASTSFSIFTLFLLTLTYLIINPIKENNHLPINPEEHYWKASLFLLPISMTTFLSLLIFFTFPPEEIITKNK